MQTSPVISSMMEAALKAAHIALYRRKGDLDPHTKIDEDGIKSNVTKGDAQSEQIIRDTLEKALPTLRQHFGLDEDEHIGFVMEETAQNFEQRKKGYYFVVDPIDGTRGYSRQDPGAPWAISIGLEKDGRTIASVVYEAAHNEYGITSQGGDLPFDAMHPQGHIFYAEAGTEGAYKVNPPEGGFTVTAAPDASYKEVLKNGLWTLESIPNFTVNTDNTITLELNKETPLAENAKVQMGDFLPDRKINQEDTGPVTMQIQKVAREDAHVDTERCLAAVTGALKAADGRAAGFVHGNGYPWDHSAVRLILKQSGTPFIEYDVPGTEIKGERTLIVAGRNASLFNAVNDTVLSLNGVAGDVIMKGNVPPGPQLRSNINYLR